MDKETADAETTDVKQLVVGRWSEGRAAWPIAGRPPRGSFQLFAGSFARLLRFLHPFRHLRFQGIEVEARTPLHRRVIEEGLEFLAHHLLDEHKTPEFDT